MNRLFLLCFIIFIVGIGHAANQKNDWYHLNSQHKVELEIRLFLTSTCPHCQKAEAFFAKLANLPITVHRYYINIDKSSLEQFNQLQKAQQQNDFIVPSIYICNARWVGFDEDASTGKELLQAINYCQKQITYDGKLTSATINTLRSWANANKITSGISVEDSPLYTIFSIAFIDVITPCALFIFSTFFSLTILSKNYSYWRNCISYTMIITFIHLIQLSQTSYFYHILPWLRIPAMLIGGLIIINLCGLVKKSSWYSSVSLPIVLGILIFSYQQTCALNWGFVFQEWLATKSLSLGQKYSYLVTYHFVYGLVLFSLLLIIGYLAQVLLAKKSYFMQVARYLLLIVAGVLIIYPYEFALMWFSQISIVLALILGRLLKWA